MNVKLSGDLDTVNSLIVMKLLTDLNRKRSKLKYLQIIKLFSFFNRYYNGHGYS